ncbi:MAG: NAD-dependent protein deacylase [Candidatus Lokiarchaeota archaeon]|nr:NAD-dependent protein deacylase [Candidatus Lokiarchaeota archaeon]MBD3341909.1 NAD-dependent protein deacylase [Candidatus Lokiarchaeota archaeon]
MLLENNYSLAAKWISEANHAVIFSGAGVSVESGIPPFRGENGLWSKYNPVFLDTNYFRAHPKKSWIRIKEIFYDFFGEADPNKAHYVISEFEKNGLIKAVITQNIDNLHQEAGSKNVVEFHGTAQTLTCIHCKKKFESDQCLNELPPLCPSCNGLLKPDFVFFGEPIPKKAHNSSINNALSSDLFILVGTTGEIMPASTIPYFAKDKGAKFIEINVQPSKYTHTIVDLFLRGNATYVFSKLKEELEKNRWVFSKV